MKKTCIFRIEFCGDLYRVERVERPGSITPTLWRVMSRRRMLYGMWYTSERLAIEAAMSAAMGCAVEIQAGSVL